MTRVKQEKLMKVTLTIAAITTLMLASPALADCASDLTKIDEAMKTATVDEATMAKLKPAVDAAKAAQTANDMKACETAAMEAKTLLGLKDG
jgi:hypothetical protein